MHWYYAIDRRGGQVIDDNDLNEHLRSLSTRDTNQRLGKIPLVLGMPVMITQNFDVTNGVVNGSIGTLTNIRYTLNKHGERVAQSCVVHVPNMDGAPMPGLQEKHAPILPDQTVMSFIHPHSNKKCKIERTQLPIVPAFAMTCHKAQGQTLEKVIVDLEGCRGTEAPYVMLSRARSLDGLHILRPFSFARLTTRPSQESRAEFRRLEILRLKTIVQYGSEPESREALESLIRANIPSDLYELQDTEKLDHGNQVRRLQAEASRQVQQMELAEQAMQNIPMPRRHIEPVSAISARKLNVSYLLYCSEIQHLYVPPVPSSNARMSRKRACEDEYTDTSGTSPISRCSKRLRSSQK